MGSCLSLCDGGRVMVDGDMASGCVQSIPHGEVDVLEDAVALDTHTFEEVVAEPSEAVKLSINREDMLGSHGADLGDESAPIEASVPELRRSASPAPCRHLGTIEGAQDDLDDQPHLWQSVSALSTRTPSTIVSAGHEKLVRKFLRQHSFRHADDSRRASRRPFAQRLSPLRLAADMGDVSMVKLLLRHGADPSRPGVLPDEGLWKRSQHGRASREEARQILLDVRSSPEARQVVEQDSLLDVSVVATPADWETRYFAELNRRLHLDPLF